ncbi:MAG: hypothetical protein WBV82_32875 [Myxococcaceae bacterium]
MAVTGALAGFGTVAFMSGGTWLEGTTLGLSGAYWAASGAAALLVALVRAERGFRCPGCGDKHAWGASHVALYPNRVCGGCGFELTTESKPRT